MSKLLDQCPADTVAAAWYLKGASLALDYAHTHSLEESRREYDLLQRIWLRLQQRRIAQVTP